MPTPDEGAPAAGQSDWKGIAEILLKGNHRNLKNRLKEKVLAGQPLTKAETDFLQSEAATEDNQEAEDRQSKHGKTRLPKFAKNQTDLARILGVSRWTVQRYGKRASAPKPKSNGRLVVAEWKEFLEGEDILEGDEQSELKAHQILLQNELLEHKLAVARGEYVAASEVEKETADLIATAKSVLNSGPASLAPQVVGVSVQEAETLIRLWLHNALAKLQKNPLGKKESADE